MMRKSLITLTLLLILLFALQYSSMFAPTALARHQTAPSYHDVYWDINVTAVNHRPPVTGKIFDSERGDYHALLATNYTELYAKGPDGTPAKSVVFKVEANKTMLNGKYDDAIIRVDVIIPQNASGYALFHLVDAEVTYIGNATANYWNSHVVEVDPRGWPRSYRFETSDSSYGIKWPRIHYEMLWFRLYFEYGPQECVYGPEKGFYVWTYDATQDAHSHPLWLMMDKTGPNITVEPADGAIVHGRLKPCGNHFFMLNVTAHDRARTLEGKIHDSGLSNYTISLDGTLFDSGKVPSPYNLPGETWHATWNVENLSNGTHTLNVTVWDGVGNPNSVPVTFTYIQPPSPLRISPGQGHAAYNTTIVDSKKGLVKSYPETYKSKALGTLVTVYGLSFGSNVDVNVTVYIPTYHYYFTKYRTYKVLVNQTKTRADGTFTATFVFPKAPAGIYNVSARSTVMECAVRFEVLPEIIFNPDEVVGPALIDVKATGFTAQNKTRRSWFFILPDALQGVNTQVDRYWYIDGNGTLVNRLNEYCQQDISTTLNWPFLQQGTYTVEIKHINGDYWNGNTRKWIHRSCFVGSNEITVASTLGLLVEIKDDIAYINTTIGLIEAKLDELNPNITRIDERVAYINTTIGLIEAKLDELNPNITRIDERVAYINTTIGLIKTTLDELSPKIDTIDGNVAKILTSVGTELKGKVDSINGTVADIKTDVGDVKATIPSLTTPIYIAAILSLIAAIAAIACAILVYRKIA